MEGKLELKYNRISDVSIKMNDVELKGVTEIDTHFDAYDLPRVRIGFELDAIQLLAEKADIELNLTNVFGRLPNEMQDKIKKMVKSYYEENNIKIKQEY